MPLLCIRQNHLCNVYVLACALNSVPSLKKVFQSREHDCDFTSFSVNCSKPVKSAPKKPWSVNSQSISTSEECNTDLVYKSWADRRIYLYPSDIWIIPAAAALVIGEQNFWVNSYVFAKWIFKAFMWFKQEKTCIEKIFPVQCSFCLFVLLPHNLYSTTKCRNVMD